MENTLPKIRLAKSFFTGKYCLKTDKGIRLTCWFKTYDETVIGDFVKFETEIGNFIYHKGHINLLYEQYGDDEEVYVHKLTEEIYYIQINCLNYMSLIQFYKADGTEITQFALEDVYAIGKNLIAAREFCGKWGILDKDLNWKIHFTYEDIFDYRDGSITGYRSERDTTDIIIIDENGNIHIVNVDGYVVEYLTNDLVVSKKGKKKGIYNTKGEKILDIAYDNVNFVDKHIILTNDDLKGIADITGKILYECKYYQISKTEDGFDLVTRKMIDTTEHITV